MNAATTIAQHPAELPALRRAISLRALRGRSGVLSVSEGWPTRHAAEWADHTGAPLRLELRVARKTVGATDTESQVGPETKLVQVRLPAPVFPSKIADLSVEPDFWRRCV